VFGMLGAAFRPATVMVVFIFLISISFLLVMGAFVKLRYHRPDLPRPYRAIGGPVMATVGIVLALVVAASCYGTQPQAMTWCVVFLLLSAAHYIARSRRRGNVTND
jgi:ethanolamine permease